MGDQSTLQDAYDGDVGGVLQLDGVGGVLALELSTLDGQVHSEPLGGGRGGDGGWGERGRS